MNHISIEALGLTKEDLADRIVERATDRLLADIYAGEDDEQVSKPSRFATAMQTRVTARINQAIDEIAGKHVLPNVASYVENLCLQTTNEWGEKKGAPMTFVEYLVQRAESYLTEPVNSSGKSKQVEGYSWSKSTTRISYLINAHLHYSIETAMKAALKDANTHIVGGIEQAVKIKLAEVLAQMKVQVKTS